MLKAQEPQMVAFKSELKKFQEDYLKKIKLATEVAEDLLMKGKISEKDELDEVISEVLKYQALVYGLKVKYGIEPTPDRISDEMKFGENTVKDMSQKVSTT